MFSVLENFEEKVTKFDKASCLKLYLPSCSSLHSYLVMFVGKTLETALQVIKENHRPVPSLLNSV